MKVGLQPGHGPGDMVAFAHGWTLLLPPELLVDEVCGLIQEVDVLCVAVHAPPCLRLVLLPGLAARSAPLQPGLHRWLLELLEELRLQQLHLRAGGGAGVAGAARVVTARGQNKHGTGQGLPLQAPHVTGNATWYAAPFALRSKKTGVQGTGTATDR